jgi:hypothetical protein
MISILLFDATQSISISFIENGKSIKLTFLTFKNKCSRGLILGFSLDEESLSSSSMILLDDEDEELFVDEETIEEIGSFSLQAVKIKVLNKTSNINFFFNFYTSLEK